MAYHAYEARQPNERKILCKCPMCWKLHNKVLNWIGRGMPRIYCTDCLDYLCNGLESEDIIIKNFKRRSLNA